MFTMFATLLLSAPVPKLQPTGNPSPEPVLIAKGKGFLIHGVVFKGEPAPATPPVPNLLPMQTVPLSHGVAILHTTTETGQMKALLTSGLSVHQSPKMGIDHQYYTTTSILGAVADAERLYVLYSFWQRLRMLPQQQPVKEVGSSPAIHELAVYRVEDGKLLHVLPIQEGDFPQGLPPETAKPGLLKLKDNGVACFGVSFTFKGTELLEQRYEKKPEP